MSQSPNQHSQDRCSQQESNPEDRQNDVHVEEGSRRFVETRLAHITVPDGSHVGLQASSGAIQLSEERLARVRTTALRIWRGPTVAWTVKARQKRPLARNDFVELQFAGDSFELTRELVHLLSVT
jgi:hypothetical protein